jgi:hypothetical protein
VHERAALTEDALTKILYGEIFMKIAGILLLFAGFLIVLSAFVVLPTNAPRGAFVLAGMAVQILGLVLTFRSHLTPDEAH